MSALPDLSQAWTLPLAIDAFADTDTRTSLDRGIEVLVQAASESEQAAVCLRRLEKWRAVLLVNGLLRRLQSGEVIAFGRIGHAAAALAPIARELWRIPVVFTEEYLARGQVTLDQDPRVVVCDLRFVRPDGVHRPPTATPRDSGGGRPPKFHWELAVQRLLIKVGLNGHPETGADLARMMQDCFQEMGEEAPTEEYAEKWLRTNMPMVWEFVRGTERRGRKT